MEEGSIEESKQQKPKHLISFTKLGIYFVYPLITPLIYGVKRYLSLEIKKKISYFEVIFLFFIINSFGFLISGIILYIFSYIKGKFGTKMNFEETEFQGIKIKSIRVILILISMAFSFQIHELFSYLSAGKHLVSKNFFYFIYIPLLSKLLLKNNVYLHQKFCLCLSILASLLISIGTFEDITKDDIIYNFNIIIDTLLLSSTNVFTKVLITKYSLSPSFCLIFLGVISILFLIIGAIIFFLIKYNDISAIKNIFAFSDYNNMGNNFYIFLSIIFVDTFVFFIVFVLTIYYFSPNLYIVSDQIGIFLFWLYQIIFTKKNNRLYSKILECFGYPISLLSAFVYNEIIVLNFCRLNKDTKIRIMEREESDFGIEGENARDSYIEIGNYFVNERDSGQKDKSKKIN